MFIQHLFSALVPGPQIVLATPAPAPQLWMFFMFRLSVRSTKKLFILNITKCKFFFFPNTVTSWITWILVNADCTLYSSLPKVNVAIIPIFLYSKYVLKRCSRSGSCSRWKAAFIIYLFLYSLYLLKQAQGRVLVILFSLDLSNVVKENKTRVLK